MTNGMMLIFFYLLLIVISQCSQPEEFLKMS